MRQLSRLSSKRLLDGMCIETINRNLQRASKPLKKLLEELKLLTADGGIRLAQYFQLCRSCFEEFLDNILDSELSRLQKLNFIESYDENGQIRVGEFGRVYRTYLGE